MIFSLLRSLYWAKFRYGSDESAYKSTNPLHHRLINPKPQRPFSIGPNIRYYILYKGAIHYRSHMWSGHGTY